jgi:hypothetical protein
MTEKKELSQLARQILSGNGHMKLYNQQEFDESLAIAKAEIMTVAIQTSRQAVFIERQACADLATEAGFPELGQAIMNRIPSQRQ